MGLYKYAFKTQDEKKVARAQVSDLDASYKDLCNVATAIRGRSTTAAMKILDEAMEMTKAIPYPTFGKGTGHKGNIGGKRGKYPKKECQMMKNLLRDAIANAQVKGLDTENLRIHNVAAFKQNVFPRYRRFWASGPSIGYGKQSVMSNYTTARIEITLSERQNAKPTAKTAKPTTKTAKPTAKAEKVAEKPTQKAEHKPAAKAEKN